MTEKRVALFVMSISSILIWDILIRLGLIGGKMQTLLVLMSLGVFIYSSFYLLNDFKFENIYYRFIFLLFFSYQLIIVIRGWSFSYVDIKTYLQTGYVFWPFMIPLFILFDKKITTFGYLFKWIYYCSVFLLFISLIYPPLLFKRVTAETFITLFVPSGFLLLNATYLSNRKTNLSFFLICIGILSLTYLARRSATGTLLGFVVAAYFLNLINRSKVKIFQYFPLIIIVVTFLLFSQFTENSKEVLLNKMAGRISEDTRSGVFELFFYYLKDDKIFGNGMDGTYYCPLWDAVVDGEFFAAVKFRNIIENGYLQLYLTGGILHVVLFVLVLLPASLLGILKSSNQFAKACGVLIFLRLVDMLFYGLPALTLAYILVWICAGVCYKKNIRNMTNDEMRR